MSPSINTKHKMKKGDAEPSAITNLSEGDIGGTIQRTIIVITTKM